MLDEEQRRQFIYPALHTHCNLLALRENMEQFSSSQVACIVLPSFIVIVKFISQKNSLNWGRSSHFSSKQYCSVLSYKSVNFSKFTNKFEQKCHCTVISVIIIGQTKVSPLITILSLFFLLPEHLWLQAFVWLNQLLHCLNITVYLLLIRLHYLLQALNFNFPT